MPQLLWQPGDSVWKGKGFLCLPGPRAALLPSRQGLTAVPIKALLCFDGAQPLLGHVLMQPEVAKCQLSLFMLLTEDLMSYRSGRELCRVFSQLGRMFMLQPRKVKGVSLHVATQSIA